MKVLITGAGGQLAVEFQRYLKNIPHYQVSALDKAKLDVTDLNAVSKAISHYKPDLVLNCSAYNQVDKAEEDFDTAYKVNAVGVKNLSSLCRKVEALFVHYSTDYIFDGTKEDFYTEDDIPNPVNNYGKSKLAGERFLAEETDNFLLFRVSWVFGLGRQSFLRKLSDLANKNRVLRVACDQISVPTYTEDIVRITLLAIAKGIKGIFHLTNSGYASRYEVVRYYIEKIKCSNLVLPVNSNFFPSAAKRPYFSAMSHSKLSSVLQQGVPNWRDAIDRFVRRAENT